MERSAAGEPGEQDESSALRARVQALEAEVRGLRDEARFFRSLADQLPQNIYRKDREGRCTYANATFLASVGTPLEEALGKTVYDYYPRELAAQYDAADRRVVETGEPYEAVEEHRAPTTDEAIYVRVIKLPVRDAAGAIVGTLGVFWDVTDTHTAERLSREHAQQAAALRELGAPLIPIAERVVAMPLIGPLDRSRASQALETLLRGVSDHRAAVVILDVTGVTSLDAEVAAVLLGAARAVRLLGADVVVTGMKPAMAQAIVDMGIAMEGIVTRGTMQSGVAYALQRRR